MITSIRLLLAGTVLATAWVRAHDTGDPHSHLPAVLPLPYVTETKGPWKRPPSAPPGAPTTGQGYWRFVAADPALMPVPEQARPFLKGAHGTLVVDAARDRVFWGLENVGWVEFSEGLTHSSVIDGDPVFAKGNLHGADLLPRRGKLPLVAVADNVQGEVYLSDTSFQNAQVLRWPERAPYSKPEQFHPTDVAFAGSDTLYVTDGYGAAWFMPLNVDPLSYRGAFYGGKTVSQTPHGITLDPADRSLLISARPEARVQRWAPKRAEWKEVLGLPPGSTVCDLDIRGDYALAPCLNGPDQTPGPVYIINLKKRAIVSTLRPKADLGFPDAQHIHDATWYETGRGRNREVYVLFTSWNPGGIGALRLVQP
jgi:hypothetical protein